MKKNDFKAWRNFVNHQLIINKKKYLNFLSYVKSSVLTKDNIIFLSDELKMDPINFTTIKRLSQLEKSQINKIVQFTRSIDFLSPLLDIPEQDRIRIIEKFDSNDWGTSESRESFYKEIDKARSKKTNNLSPEGLLAEQVLKKVWKTISKESDNWVFPMEDKDKKRLEKLSIHTNRKKDTEYNWAAGICINAIKFGDICSLEDGGSESSDYLYKHFYQHAT